MMPVPLKVALVLFGGAALGLAATAAMLGGRIDPAAIRSGPWVLWPKSGTSDIDPYARAVLAQTATIPLAATEGLSFSAARDEGGTLLSARCIYRLDGPVPGARAWTLTASTPAGHPMDSAVGRSAFSSSEIVRQEGGGFTIVMGPSARPGNWLPVSGDGRFVLTLRLYDTPLASTAGEIAKAALPRLSRIGCAS